MKTEKRELCEGVGLEGRSKSQARVLILAVRVKAGRGRVIYLSGRNITEEATFPRQRLLYREFGLNL